MCWAPKSSVSVTKLRVTQLVGYSDANFAGDSETSLSTSGFTFMKSRAAITWKSKKQMLVTLSTSEAEYVALSAASQEVVWL